MCVEDIASRLDQQESPSRSQDEEGYMILTMMRRTSAVRGQLPEKKKRKRAAFTQVRTALSPLFPLLNALSTSPVNLDPWSPACKDSVEIFIAHCFTNQESHLAFDAQSTIVGVLVSNEKANRQVAERGT